MSRIPLVCLLPLLGLACGHSATSPAQVGVSARAIWEPSLFSTPPGEPLRPLAEWELGDAVALVYPGHELEEETSNGKDDESLAGNVRAELRQRFTAVRQGSQDNLLFWSVLPHAARHSRVLVVLHDAKQWDLFMRGLRIRRLTHLADRIELFQSPYDSPWIRDYAPLFVAGRNNQPLVMDTLYCPDSIGDFNSLTECVRQTSAHSRKQDDLFPYRLAQQFGVDWHRVPLVLEGGNFQSDSHGTCFTSRKTLVHNGDSQPQIDRQLHDYMGCRQVIYLEPIPGDTLSHIDMFFRVLADDLFVLADYRSIAHPTTPRGHVQEKVRKALDQSYQILRQQRPHARIVRIPMPDVIVDSGGTINFASPLNFLRLRGVLLVPHFSWSLEQQADALRVLRKLLPEHEIIPIAADWLLRAKGAIHCLSANLPNMLPRGGSTALPTALPAKAAPTGGERVRFTIPPGAPGLGPEDALIRVVYHGELTRNSALRFAEWARAAAAWPDEVSLKFVPRAGAAGNWGVALAGALGQGRFWAGWDALFTPWPAKSSDEETPAPAGIEGALASLYAHGVDALPIENMIASGRALSAATAITVAGTKDRAYVNGLPMEPDLPADEILALLRRELATARYLLAGGAKRKDIPERILQTSGPPAAAQEAELVVPGWDTSSSLIFFHDYQSARSVDLARLLARQRYPVQIRCVSYAHHPVAELACEAAHAAAAAGRFRAFHDQLLQAGENITSERVFAIAAALGLDTAGLAWSLAQHEHDGFVLRDLRLLQKLPGGEAPLVIVGNRGYRYQDKQHLAQVLEIKP